MAKNEKNYSVMENGAFAKLAEKGRIEAGKELGLTGCEISFNTLPAGQGIPFLHSHKRNEEVYIIISGSGTFKVDADEIPVQEGSVIRVAPDGIRTITASDTGLTYICIQAEHGSLTQCTMDDGVVVQ